jgi:molecular chaperone HscB
MTSTPTAPAERTGAALASPPLMRCSACGATHPPQPFCPQCDAIQALPANVDYFQILGIESRLIIDGDALDRRYFDLSRRVHPDRFQTGSAQARIASLGNTAALNRAYRTLRDPVERGLYWLGLQGESLGANNNQVPADLAALVFEVQEHIETLRDAGGQAEQVVGELRRARAALATRLTTLLLQLDENFRRWDDSAAPPAILTAELKAILSAVKYVRTLMRDVDRALEHR